MVHSMNTKREYELRMDMQSKEWRELEWTQPDCAKRACVARAPGLKIGLCLVYRDFDDGLARSF